MAQKVLFHYNCMFHYADKDRDIPRIVEWLHANTGRFFAVAEHEHHLNPTKKHLQVILEIDHEWTKSWSNYWTSGRGSKSLQKDMIAESGEKKPKRWGGKRWNSGFMEGVEYCLKEEAKSSYVYSSDPDLEYESLKNTWYTKHPQDKQKQGTIPHKTKSFQQRMLDYWSLHGEPRTERECFSLMCDFISDENWRYIDDRSILRAARWLYSRASRPTWKERLMSSYDDNQILI